MKYLPAIAMLAAGSMLFFATAHADELADLRKQKLEVAKKWRQAYLDGYETENVRSHLQKRYAISRAVMESERNAATTKEARIAAVRAHLELVTLFYKQIHALFVEDAFGGAPHDLYRSECLVLEARQWLREEQARAFP